MFIACGITVARGTQCDQIWRFLKLLSYTFSKTKVAQIFAYILGFCQKHYFVSKNRCGSFLATVCKIWLLFIPTSGHTGTGTLTSQPGIKFFCSYPSLAPTEDHFGLNYQPAATNDQLSTTNELHIYTKSSNLRFPFVVGSLHSFSTITIFISTKSDNLKRILWPFTLFTLTLLNLDLF